MDLMLIYVGYMVMTGLDSQMDQFLSMSIIHQTSYCAHTPAPMLLHVSWMKKDARAIMKYTLTRRAPVSLVLRVSVQLWLAD